MKPTFAGVVALALASLPNCGAAGAAMDDAYQAAIDKAKSCDDQAALAFSKLDDETAEAVARAAFEKCRPLWVSADKANPDQPWVYHITPEDVAKHPDLASDYLKQKLHPSSPEDRHIDKWNQVEFERLLVFVMEARLKSLPAH